MENSKNLLADKFVKSRIELLEQAVLCFNILSVLTLYLNLDTKKDLFRLFSNSLGSCSSYVFLRKFQTGLFLKVLTIFLLSLCHNLVLDISILNILMLVNVITKYSDESKRTKEKNKRPKESSIDLKYLNIDSGILAAKYNTLYREQRRREREKKRARK